MSVNPGFGGQKFLQSQVSSSWRLPTGHAYKLALMYEAGVAGHWLAVIASKPMWWCCTVEGEFAGANG